MLKTDKIFNNSSPFTLLLKKDIDLTKKIHLLSKKEIIKLFFEAIKNGKSTKIFDILQPYIDINQCDSDGNTPLHIAVKHNRVDMVKMLINLDDIDFTLKDKDGKTAFGCAKQPEIKDLISEKLFYQLVNLILSGSIDELKAFIDLFSELDINSCGIFLQHGGVLHYAAMSTEIRNKDYLEILSFLLSLSNIDINQLNIKNGETPLHIAANHSDLKTIDKLLSAGAQANPISRYGDTPLHFACDRGHYEVVQALLLAGTDPFQKNNNEQYCFDMIANTTQKSLIKEIIRSHIFHHHFCKAVKESDADKIRHILSCVTNNLNNIKFRLNNLHFDPNETIDTKGNRALTYSAKNNDIDSVKALLFSPKTNINLKDADGKTALHYAIENKNLEIVGLLLSQQNMDITIKDPNGKSYLDLISNTSKAMKVIGVKLKDKVFETFKTSILEGNIELSKQLIEAFSKATSDSDYSIGSYSDVTGETTLDCILNPQSAVNAELFKMLLDSGADP